mgnify:CR=1 FL=1
MITKDQFEKLVGIELIEQGGKLVYYGDLDLFKREDITELPDNLRVLGDLVLNQSGVTKLPKGLEVIWDLYISGTSITELPEDTKFGGHLYINNMKKPFSFPKKMRVNSSFECRNTTIKRMPEELYVNWSCNLSRSTFDKLPKVMEVDYILNLYETSITELPEGLVVGCKLDIHDANLKDHSNLHKVCSEFIIDEDKYEEIKDTLAKHSKENVWYDEIAVIFEPNYKGAYLFENKNGKYIKADEIFGKIVEQKGNVYHVKLVGDEEITYLVTDGEGHWSHGYTLEGAKDDLIYKITDRDKSDYEGLTLDSELSFEDAIVCYRVITGACSFGTKNFIENRLGKNKKEVYTIKEIIKLTNGEYGNKTFKDFFCKE